ncbi:MAG: 30S ribosomal protein S2 [Candidatus Yanofskybacteria bacterium]|nr:30S ribosomal protein S2 [Candidatus Yanofskybacteria bacterium]
MLKNETRLPSYEEMIRAGMHLGRKKSIFNPKMKPHVYLMRDGIYIIDLIKTKQGLASAVDFLRKALEEKKLVLFVGISKQSSDLVRDLAESLGMPYAINRWLGGTLTNFKTVISRLHYLESLEADFASGAFEKYTKKERLMKEKEMAKLKEKFDGLRKLNRVPDILFVSSVKESDLPIREAKKMKVKIAGLINTESDPSQIDFPIPANDNARKSLELIIKAIKDSLL